MHVVEMRASCADETILTGYAACVKKFDFSNKDAVIPDTTQMLGYKPPTNYMIGTLHALSHS